MVRKMSEALYALGFIVWVLVDFSKVPFQRGSPPWQGIVVFEAVYLISFATVILLNETGGL
jgi:hypothetical protein